MQNAENLNPVLRIAREDYAADLVNIVESAIAQCQPGETLQSMGATVPVDSLCRAMEGIPYFIAMDSINYQFWDVAESGDFVRYRHHGLEGALAMQQAFRQAWEAQAQLVQHLPGPSHTAFIVDSLRERIENHGVTGIFGDIPAASSRADILFEVLADASRLYVTSETLLSSLLLRGKLGWQEAELLAQTFPRAYRDRYLKKAQLTLMFIAGQWNEHNPRQACRLDVTAAADYQLPKILRAMGILSYSPELAARVDAQQLIAADSREERAIRAATVLACEKLAEHLNCTLPQVDFWLWVNRNQARSAQFHLTQTTAY